jgi:nucleoside-diphosphate-sugar epimerase
LTGLGATAVRLDVLDARAVLDEVTRAQPDAIVHQATALAQAKFGRSLDKTFAPTNPLRTAGTDALVAAAREAGVSRLVAQSFAPYRYIRTGGAVKTEADPLDPHVPASARATFAAMGHLEDTVLAAGGTVLRYGGFYGLADQLTESAMLNPIRKRQYPIIGDGSAMMSFIHLDDAASATALVVEQGKTGIFNIVDDEPAAMRDWVPYLAKTIGAKPPLRVPAWTAALIMGREAAEMLGHTRGASNALARRELGWVPRYGSWREGFAVAYGR